MHNFEFGDIIENGWASDANPTKRGVFIHYKYRGGRMNPGKKAIVRFESGAIGAFPIDNQAELKKVGTIFDDLATELATLRAGIKRLSDEEELCAETTGDDPFSLIYLAAKAAAAETEVERFRRRLETVERAARLALDVQHERDFLAMEARRFASNYPEASDGRNTFIIFAEMIERRVLDHQGHINNG